jgi:glutaconyl-CoA/methylmalonyl-CoA decarboxylase subunit gamma
MKYKVSISDRSYEVEIEDIHARPIIAYVDGQKFEVNPEEGSKPAAREEATESKSVVAPIQSAVQTKTSNELTAPLPGTIVSIFVKAGDEIEAGKVVLIIEAMKMKNSIRTTRGGKVAEVLVDPGQTVTHKQALLRFTE